MTTLTFPSLEWRLLGPMKEEAETRPIREWPPQSLQLCLELLRRIRESGADVHQRLEGMLADGIEARSFAREFGPHLPAADASLAKVRETIDVVSSAADAGDAGSESLLAELRPLEQETQALRDLLAEALSRASESPRLVDWGRVRAAEEAYARGETKPFARP